MVTSSPRPATSKRVFDAKHAMWVVFGLMTLFVLLTREMTLLDPNSFLRQRYARFASLLPTHGIPGAVALILGAFQFSSRLRQRHLQVHRVMGRIYVGCVAISAPVAVMVAYSLTIPTLNMAATIQSFGWMATTATALYCVRTGRIQQHREWMMRSYPFAMVFVVVRAVVALPPIARMGVVGLQTVVWSTIATACFLPSFVIAWQTLATSRRTSNGRARMAAD